MNKYLNLLISLNPALIILIGTILFFTFSPRFDIVGDDLIKFGNFEEKSIDNSTTRSFLDKLSGWNENTKWKKNNGYNKTAGILLQSEKNNRCKLKLNLLDIDKYYPLLLLFKLKAKSQNIIKGKNSWDVGCVDMIFKDFNKNKIKNIKHNVASLSGSNVWKEYYMIFKDSHTCKKCRYIF